MTRINLKSRTGKKFDLVKQDILVRNMVLRAIRRMWSRASPDREHALWLARDPEYPLYLCAVCKEQFKIKEVQVDHINPVGSQPMSLEAIQQWVSNLFCSYNNLQVLCKLCHKQKTKVDVKKIREGKKKKKE